MKIFIIILGAVVAVLIVNGFIVAKNKKSEPILNKVESVSTAGKYTKPSNEAIKSKLTPLQYQVTQEDGTETPFNNEYWNNHEAGLYVDVVSGEPLFSSKDKFDSGTGWPSFTKPISPAAIIENSDTTFGMARNEIKSTVAHSHLGHVFNDGPAPAGLRYCMNSASLRFIPAADLKAQGYGEFAVLFK